MRLASKQEKGKNDGRKVGEYGEKKEENDGRKVMKKKDDGNQRVSAEKGKMRTMREEKRAQRKTRNHRCQKAASKTTLDKNARDKREREREKRESTREIKRHWNPEPEAPHREQTTKDTNNQESRDSD